jgi:hypothetical protein
MNWEIIVREFDDGRPLREHVVVRITRPAELVRMSDLGMRLEEGKAALARMQNVIVAAQADSDSRLRRTCPACGAYRRSKDYRRRRIDTVFGRVSVRLKRTTGGCPHKCTGPVLPRGRSTPEYDALRAKLAAELSYRKARAFLSMTLPVSTGLALGTIRAHTFRVATRLVQRDAASHCGRQSDELALGLDTAYIRSCSRENGRHLPVVVGEVTNPCGEARVFGAVDQGKISEAEVIRANLQAHGLAPHTAVTVFTDGEDRLRVLARRALRGPVTPVLDWFHIGMRIQHIRQLSRGLTTRLPSHTAATRVVHQQLDLMRWRLWNGRADAVDGCLDRVSEAIGAFRRYPPNRRARMAISGLFTMLYDLRRYVRGNAHLITDYASSRRAGRPISTARVESAVNRLVNRRMNKSQQMRWSPRGAQLLLLVRAAVLNREFDEKPASTEPCVDSEVHMPVMRAA